MLMVAISTTYSSPIFGVQTILHYSTLSNELWKQTGVRFPILRSPTF